MSYKDAGAEGYELLTADVIEEGLRSFLNCPAIIGHVTTRKPVPKDRVRGLIDKVGRDSDGWFTCEGSVNAEADDFRREIHNGREPSCGYSALAFDETPGTWHNIPYVRKIAKIKFHHLGVVQNARYEEADIRLNNKNTAMNPLKWIAKKLRPKQGGGEEEVTETGTLAPGTVVEIDGQEVKLNELVDAHKARGAAAQLSADDPTELTGDTEIEVDGKSVKLNELVESFKAKKEADEKAAAATVKLNARKQGAKSFRVLQEASSKPVNVFPVRTAATVGDEDESFARGAERYSSGKHAKN